MPEARINGRIRTKRRIDRTEAARQWNNLVSNVARLYEDGAEGRERPMLSVPDHPWKILVTSESGGTFKITVKEGNCYDCALYPDLNGDAVSGTFPSTVTETEFTALAATSDNGIWLESDLATPGSIYPAIHNAGGQDLHIDNFAVHRVIKDATRLTPTSANFTALIVAQAATAYTYIGRVTLAAGVATIRQDLKNNFGPTQPSYLDHP